MPALAHALRFGPSEVWDVRDSAGFVTPDATTGKRLLSRHLENASVFAALYAQVTLTPTSTLALTTDSDSDPNPNPDPNPGPDPDPDPDPNPTPNPNQVTTALNREKDAMVSRAIVSRGIAIVLECVPLEGSAVRNPGHSR